MTDNCGHCQTHTEVNDFGVTAGLLLCRYCKHTSSYERRESTATLRALALMMHELEQQLKGAA